MKKIILSAAMAMLAFAAYAQTKAKSEVNVNAKGKEKSAEMRSKTETRIAQFDLNMDGELSVNERAARKAYRKQESRSRKADRADDGLVNGSASENNVHGKAVSGFATTTDLEGREKGEAISGLARSKSEMGLNGALETEVRIDKESRKQAARTRRADRADDGLLNGSADANIHGKTASKVAVGTNLKGKAKGTEVSTGAKIKAKPGKGVNVSAGKKVRVGL